MTEHESSGLFARLTSWDTLLLAYQRAASGKRGKRAAAMFEHRLEENLLELQQALRDKSYRPGRYHSFYIHEPKRRLISAAPFRDRVVHHALCHVTEPPFERGFITDSYANRVGKGTHRALDRCQQFARHYTYCLQLDVAQFFPSIDHTVLRATLFHRVVDRDLRWLIDLIINSGIGVNAGEYTPIYFPGDDLFALDRPRGLPIGNLTSQFWANCYLDPLDHYIKRHLRCPAYIRFVDDMLLFSNDKNELAEWRDAVTLRLAALRLTVHPAAQARPVGEGVSFLGFRLFPEHRRLKRRKGVHFAHTFRGLLQDYAAQRIWLDNVSVRVAGWVNHVRYANTVGLRKSVLLAQPVTRPAHSRI